MVIDLRKKTTLQELDHGIRVYQNFSKEHEFTQLVQMVESLEWRIVNVYNDGIPEEMQEDGVKPHIDIKIDSRYNKQNCHLLLHSDIGIFPEKPLERDLFDFLYGRLMNIFDVYAWQKIKTNANFCTDKIIEHGYHVDRLPRTELSHTQLTGVLHLDDSDGYTKFQKDNITVPSQANQLIVFPADLYHTGTTCTDQAVRRVININFFGLPC